MKIKYLSHLIIAFSSMSVFTVYGQDDDEKITIDDHYVDFAVPDLGAHTLLNIDAEKVARPGNIKEVGAELLNIVSSGSGITPGIAIDWSPYRSFSKKYFDYKNYKKNPHFYNMALSYGTIRDSLGTKLALGFKWVFIDKSDPLQDESHTRKINSLLEATRVSVYRSRQDLVQKFQDFRIGIDAARNFTNGPLRKDSVLRWMFFFAKKDTTTILDANLLAAKAIERIDSIITQTNASANMLSESEKATVFEYAVSYLRNAQSIMEYKVALEKAYFKLQKEYKKNHWNASVAQVGFGWVANSKSNTWDSLKTASVKAYFSGAKQLGKWGQLIGMLSYTQPKVDIENDSTITSGTFVGARLLAGSSDYRFSFELGYTGLNASTAKYDVQKMITTVGFELKIDDGIWLEVAAGLNGPPENYFKKSSIVSIGSFKYALQKKRRFDMN